MTTNKLILSSLAQHMSTPADSGVSRLTRSWLFTALHSTYGNEDRCWAFIKFVDAERERRLFARQAEHKALLATCIPPSWSKL